MSGGSLARAGALAGLLAGLILAAPAHALDAAQRAVVDEACPPLDNEEPGPNGVMSPREVRCRLSMGESYDEVATDIKARQREEAQRQSEQADALRQEQTSADQARRRALSDAVPLCERMVQEAGQGRWFTSQATAPGLINTGDPHGHAVDPSMIAQVTAFMDGLGHNYSEPDQRTLVLRGMQPEGTLSFWQLNPMLDELAAAITARADAAEFDSSTGRYAERVVLQPASAADYAFRCLLQARFGSITADPFDRAVRLDSTGHYVGTR